MPSPFHIRRGCLPRRAVQPHSGNRHNHGKRECPDDRIIASSRASRGNSLIGNCAASGIHILQNAVRQIQILRHHIHDPVHDTALHRIDGVDTLHAETWPFAAAYPFCRIPVGLVLLPCRPCACNELPRLPFHDDDDEKCHACDPLIP